MKAGFNFGGHRQGLSVALTPGQAPSVVSRLKTRDFNQWSVDSTSFSLTSVLSYQSLQNSRSRDRAEPLCIYFACRKLLLFVLGSLV
jgi:hypothetical protein